MLAKRLIDSGFLLTGKVLEKKKKQIKKQKEYENKTELICFYLNDRSKKLTNIY